MFAFTVNPIKLETGLRPNSAGIPYTLLLRIEAMGFPTFGLLLSINEILSRPKQTMGLAAQGLELQGKPQIELGF